MEDSRKCLQERIHSQEILLLAEITPPDRPDPEPVRRAARQLCGKVHALGISDNREGPQVSALAAASLVLGEGVEPILHMVTRDRNRIDLTACFLGGQTLGLRNFLCTSGTHQTLGAGPSAKNVHDIDSTQLLYLLSHLGEDASALGRSAFQGLRPACLGAVANPYADPLEMQILGLLKKKAAGAEFLITQPVFDLERFGTWWREVTQRGLHEKVAIVAGITPLIDAEEAEKRAGARPDPVIPEAVIARLKSEPDKKSQREQGVALALETIEQLKQFAGIRGIALQVDETVEPALEILERSAFRAS